MRDLVRMWNDTRMVVLTAISAALYAAILIPFKVIPIIPGITELRPANAIPVVCSFLFGPAAAWGAAIGNVIGDFFGGFGPGDVFGFVGNLLYGLLPYKLWGAMGGGVPIPRGARAWMRFGVAVGIASLACAVVVGWGLNVLGFHPFSLLAPIVFINNFLMAMLLAPVLLAVLYPRVARGRLLYQDLVVVESVGWFRRWCGVTCIVVGAVSGFVIGIALSLDWVGLPGVSAPGTVGGTRALVVGLGVPPSLCLLFLGLALL